MDVEIIIVQEIDIKNSGSRVRVSFPAQAAVIVLDIVMGEHINPKGLFLTAIMKAVQQDFISFFHN